MDTTQTSPLKALRGAADADYRLRVVACPDPRRRGTFLPLRTATSIGRRADLAFEDARMSGEHARFQRTANGLWWVQDVESKNGLFVSQRAVERRVLVDGDVLRAGDTVLLFEREPVAVDSRHYDGVADAAASLVLVDELARAAQSNLHVLLVGATGTGKEVAAAALHSASGRSGPLVAVNAGAIPSELLASQLFGHRRGAFTGAHRDHDGFLLAASGGTLFLDEVAELTPSAQVALLRAIEQREVVPVGAVTPLPVDLHLVAATNSDLEAAVADKRFREDLLARLDEWRIELPPLRARRGDIPGLIERFGGPGTLDRCDADALEALLTYAWPLNVRELRTVVRRAVARSSDQLTVAVLPDELTAPVLGRASAARAYVGRTRPSREELVASLERHGGSVSGLAREYGKDRRQIYRWLNHYDLGE
ncbi:MAG: DNA-binding NtrC family response regulator [Myxococcota bacterium]|jgi:DNA-binding NtrC family response regulator